MPSSRLLRAGASLGLLLAVMGCAHRGAGRLEAPHRGEIVEVDAQAPKVLDFALLDQHGRFFRLSERQAKVVVLYVQGNGCPIVRQNIPGILALQQQYSKLEVEWIFLNANPQDSREAIVEEMKAYGAGLSVLRDTSQDVARSLGIERTGEVLLIDPTTLRQLWRGPLDDRSDYGAQKAEPTQCYLALALEAVLAGEAPVAAPAAKGCRIAFGAPAATDFADVAPILVQRCVPCHRDGGVGPFALKSHAKAHGMSAAMEEVLLSGRMPPWQADPEIGVFANDGGLSPQEKQSLLAWIRRGAPAAANGLDPLASQEWPKRADGGWSLGTPDLILEIPQQVIPAAGVMDYVELDLPTAIAADTWVRAVEFLPSEPEVVHHAFVFARYPSHLADRQPDAKDGLADFFAAYAPGWGADAFPEGTGKWLPRGSVLRVQLHYTPIGRALVDRMKIGIYYHNAPPPQELRVTSVYNMKFDIPAGAAAVPVEASRRVPREATLLGIVPHMHLRGSSVKVEVRSPRGGAETLLSLPRYDMNWQRVYWLKEPKKIPAGSRIVAEGVFDNSAANPLNPDPTAPVRPGEQTSDEMFVVYLLYTLDP